MVINVTKTKDYLYLPVWVRVLIDIGYNGKESIVKISGNTSSAYAHTLQVINILEKKGLLEIQRVGRRRQIKLTNKGRKTYVSALALKGVVADGK